MGTSLVFPKVLDTDWEKDKKIAYKQTADAAIAHFLSKSNKRARFTLLYDSYNGTTPNSAYNYLTKTYGQQSKTKYVDYKLARTKIQQLEGEFLKMGLKANCTTINRDEVQQKMNDAYLQIGASVAKPTLEALKERGFDTFPGAKIPEFDDKTVKDAFNIKTRNERVCQRIVDKKLASEKMKLKFDKNFIDLMTTAECFGKVERDPSGNDTFRIIEPKDMIYLESVYDPFLERTPFIGEKKMMYVNEILGKYKDLDPKDRNRIVEYSRTGIDELPREFYEYMNGSLALAVYIVEFKTVDKVRYKKFIEDGIEKEIEISAESWFRNKDKYEKEEKKGLATFEEVYKETIREVHRIGKDIYVNMQICPNYMQDMRGGEKYFARYNYCGLLHGTADGTRVSLVEMAYELSETFNILMFQVRRELGKLKGKVFTYDRAYKPDTKTVKQIFYEMTEEGFLEYDSSQDGQFEGDRRTPDKAIGEMDLGISNTIDKLLMVAGQIERILDRITGINENRQGNSKATMTATGINNSIEASQSMTYSLYYYFQQYQENVLLSLVEKTKINWAWLKQNAPGLLLGDDDLDFVNKWAKISNDEFGLYMSDGRKEADLRARLKEWIPVSINAGEMTPHDAAEAEMQDSIGDYIAVLRKAWNNIQDVAREQTASKERIAQAQMENQKNIMEADREDRQKHESDLEMIKGEIKKEVEVIKGIVKKDVGNAEALNRMLENQEKHEHEIALGEQQRQIASEEVQPQNPFLQ